jgi:tetratricopeptide (TPR) repeat protein
MLHPRGVKLRGWTNVDKNTNHRERHRACSPDKLCECATFAAVEELHRKSRDRLGRTDQELLGADPVGQGNEKESLRRLHQTGIVYKNKGDFDRAIADYTRATQIDPKDGLAYNNRGWPHYKKDEFDLAIADYTMAIALNYKSALTYQARGQTYAEKKQYDLAIQDYNEAIKIDPKDVRCFNSRGYAYLNKGQIDRAVQDYDQALKLDPNNADAIRLRADAIAKKTK